MQNKENMIFAHRGVFGNGVPENSLSAFESAIASGMGIELDVRLSKDKIPVVFHDKTLRRMCGINKKISSLTADELGRIRLGDSMQTIPTLEQVLSLVDGRVPVLIETKMHKKLPCFHTLERKMLPILKRYKGEYMIQSFNKFSVRFMKKNLPRIKCGILSGRHYGEPKGFDFISYKMKGASDKKILTLKKKYPTVLGWGEMSENEFFLDGRIL